MFKRFERIALLEWTNYLRERKRPKTCKGAFRWLVLLLAVNNVLIWLKHFPAKPQHVRRFIELWKCSVVNSGSGHSRKAKLLSFHRPCLQRSTRIHRNPRATHKKKEQVMIRRSLRSQVLGPGWSQRESRFARACPVPLCLENLSMFMNMKLLNKHCWKRANIADVFGAFRTTFELHLEPYHWTKSELRF